MPEWCNYTNTGGNPENVTSFYKQTYYDNEQLNEEIFDIIDSAGETYTMCASHAYFETDYYHDDDYYYDWNKDHMMAPTLSLKKNGIFFGDTYQHPTDVDTRTHIRQSKNVFEINPDYEGKFCITVECSSSCDCVAKDYTVVEEDEEDLLPVLSLNQNSLRGDGD